MNKISELIKLEQKRQEETLMMIPSENYASKAVREAVGSVLMNKYSEGYAGRRYYQGNKVADEVENFAVEIAKKLFKVEHVNVQPYSGSPANSAVLFGLLKPEKRELVSRDPNAQSLLKCIDMADFKIENDSTIKSLNKKIESAILEFKNKTKEKPVEKYKRPSWDEYFMEIMAAVSKRSTCDRGRASCVIVKDKQILATGYAGAPVGLPHCDDVGHQMKKMIHEDGTITEHCVRTVHAEQNAICQAAKRGISIDGSTVYVNMTPCRTCAMLLINSGVKRVHATRKYQAGKESEQMFKKAGVKLEFKFDEVQTYR